MVVDCPTPACCPHAGMGSTQVRWYADIRGVRFVANTKILFLVIVSMLPQLGPACDAVLRVVPNFAAFAILAPPIGWFNAAFAILAMSIGWFDALVFRLNALAGRAVAYSAGTQNSFVFCRCSMRFQAQFRFCQRLSFIDACRTGQRAGLYPAYLDARQIRFNHVRTFLFLANLVWARIMSNTDLPRAYPNKMLRPLSRRRSGIISIARFRLFPNIYSLAS